MPSKAAVRKALREVRRLCPGMHNDDGTCEWCNAAEAMAGRLLDEEIPMEDGEGQNVGS